MAAGAAAAALVLTCVSAQAPATGQATEKKKQVKDQGEFEIYNQSIKDAANPQKEVQDLDTWSQKYPNSDFKDDRLYMYMQAYSAMQPPQPQKVVDYGQQLMAKDLNEIFPGAAGGRNVLTVLFQVAWNVAALPNPTPEQLALGDKAAHELLDFAPKYFVASNKPASTSQADWEKARDDIEKRAQTALRAIALAPANQALAAKNYPAAEAAFTKALGEYPDSAAASYGLGRALVGEAAANPDKSADLNARAIYEFVRASVVDATLGGRVPAKEITDYAANVYTKFHGSADGLDQLQQLAKASPLPPAGFSIETATAVAARKQKEFAEKNPQLALWMGIKSQLADTNGEQYFEGQLKDADVSGQNGTKALKGTILEAKPACRSKELLVAIPEPGSTAAPHAEITLVLDPPLTGKPETGQTIEWNGVPKSFSKDPFMLTMETEKDKIEGLKTTPCAAPVHRTATKKKQ